MIVKFAHHSSNNDLHALAASTGLVRLRARRGETSLPCIVGFHVVDACHRVPEDGGRTSWPCDNGSTFGGLVTHFLHGIEEVLSILVLCSIRKVSIEHVEVLVPCIDVSSEAVDRWIVAEETLHLRPRPRPTFHVRLGAAHLAEEEGARVLLGLDDAVERRVLTCTACIVTPTLDVQAEDVHRDILAATEHVVCLRNHARVAAIVRVGIHQRDHPHAPFCWRSVLGIAPLHVLLEIASIGLEHRHEFCHLHVEFVTDHNGQGIGIIELANHCLTEAQDATSFVTAACRLRVAGGSRTWQPAPLGSCAGDNNIDSQAVGH
mmetsp:Transcript_27232/g.41182  ORF Transcript_27232/g.41182 Transcript_27232/m.41182 type:complete len:319 (+) Transcript_27232:245-1201(+)